MNDLIRKKMSAAIDAGQYRRYHGLRRQWLTGEALPDAAAPIEPPASIPLAIATPVQVTAPYPTAKPSRLAVSERPRNRAEDFGFAALSDTELLALVIQGAGSDADSAVEKARELMVASGTLGAIASQTADEIAVTTGEFRAKQIAAVMEISRRVLTESHGESPLLDRAAMIYAYMQAIAQPLDVEKFWVLCLNRKNRLIKRVEVTSGTATAALAHPREVFRAAIRESSAAIICVHNHPSGDPAPSAADLNVTRQLREASKAVEIEMIDHVILGRAGADPLGRGFFSFREAGIL